MKRFLATLSIMAMIVSMFSGVVLADAPTIQVNVELDNDMVTYVDGFNQATITGRIVDSETGAVRDVDTTLWVVRDGDGDGVYDSTNGDFNVTDDVLGTTVTGGMFTLTFLTDLGIGTYFVIGEDVTGFEFDEYASFTIMYATELVEPTTLEWTWGDIPDTVIVQGIFPNEDFDYEADDLFLAYKDNPNTLRIATADFVNDSVFGFLFDGAALNRTGELALYVDTNQYTNEPTFEDEADYEHSYVVMLEGEVVPAEMDVTVDPMEAMVNLGDVEFTATFDFADEYLDGDSLGDAYTLWVTIDGESGEWTYDITDWFDDQEVVEWLPLDGIEPGMYEFTFELVYYNNPPGADNIFDGVIEEATLELEALEPDDYNLVGWDDSALKVGDNTFSFYGDEDGREITVLDEDGDEEYWIEAIFNGAGLEDETFNENDDDDFDVSPTQTGMVEVTINVYDDSDMESGDLVHTFTRELAVEGWNITITPDVVDVDSEVDITITITDEDGNPINNAIITSDLSEGGMISEDEVIFDGTVTNVVGGVYVIEYDDEKLAFDRVGFYDLQFWTETQYENSEDTDFSSSETGFSFEDAEIDMNKAIEVVGLDVYNVTSDTAVLLEGFEEEIVVTPLDADGDVIYPNMTVTYYDADGDELATDDFTGTRVDTNDDGIKESVEGDVTPVADAVKAVIRAESSDEKEYGEVELEVVKPQVVMTGTEIISECITADIEFTVIDPRDGSMLDNPVDFDYDSDYIYSLKDADRLDECPKPDASIEEEDGVYTSRAVTGWVYWDDAEDDEVDVVIQLWMEADENILLLEIPVMEATLTADPAEMIIGTAANLVLTYADAEGNLLEGYDVYLFEDEIGTTDENGQVAYATIAGNTGTLEFWAMTDRDGGDYVVECDVPVVVDLEAPTATLVEANGMATITITDNVRVQKAMVNGVLVDMFFAAPTVVHMMPQTDLYHVQAIDQNFNYLMVTLEGARVNMLTVVIGEDCGGFGPAELVNEKTMVPVRYAEELGAVVNWNAPTASVTYTLNDGAIVITVQVGNTTAMVNGVAMEMAVAPYVNAQNRVMVPLRMIAQELGFSVDYVGGGTTYIY